MENNLIRNDESHSKSFWLKISQFLFFESVKYFFSSTCPPQAQHIDCKNVAFQLRILPRFYASTRNKQNSDYFDWLQLQYLSWSIERRVWLHVLDRR